MLSSASSDTVDLSNNLLAKKSPYFFKNKSLATIH